jgi:hypothetical protein
MKSRKTLHIKLSKYITIKPVNYLLFCWFFIINNLMSLFIYVIISVTTYQIDQLQSSSKEISKMKSLKTFSFKLKDSFFPQTFSGTIQSSSIKESSQQLKEEYAAELGTDQEEITIIELKEVN